MDDDNNNNENKTEEEISYEKYKLLLELKKEKELNDLIQNKNLSIQEKMIINLENEYIQLKLENSNILYSNEEMLRLYPNDKDVIESREINLDIYNKNEKRIIEIKQKIDDLKLNLREENEHQIPKDKDEDKKFNEEKNKDIKRNERCNNNENILEELEL